MNAVDPTKAGVASGVLSMSRMVGGTFGVAAMGALITGLGRSKIDETLPQLPRVRAPRARRGPRRRRDGRRAAAVHDAVQTAFLYALNDGLRIAAVVAVARRHRRLAAHRGRHPQAPAGPRRRERRGRHRRRRLRAGRRGRDGAGVAAPTCPSVRLAAGAGPSRGRRSADPRAPRAGASSSGSSSTAARPSSSPSSGERFGLHPLAIEDTQEFGQRPKLDDYGDTALLVFYGVDPDGTPVEVHFHVSGAWMITVHQAGHALLAEARRERIRRETPKTEEEAIYRVLDALTDSFFPVLDGVDDRIDVLMDAMLLKPSQDQREELFHLRRRLIELRRIATPQRDILARGGDVLGRLPGLEADDARDWFRDVYDHLVRISELIDSYRDLLSGALDLYLEHGLQPPQRDLQAADGRRHDLPAPDVRHRLLRPELRHPGAPHQHAVGLLGLRRGRHAAGGGRRCSGTSAARASSPTTERHRPRDAICRNLPPRREPNTDFQRVFQQHGR